MFDNILGQAASERLTADITGGAMAPSMLFSGPPASGKGTAALELGRVISCEQGEGRWNCPCPACARHRLLLHPDLMALGSRPFAAEIAAALHACYREPEAPHTRTLFIRAARKLLLRFSPVLLEDDPKLAKLIPLITALNEDLEELDFEGEELDQAKFKKRGDAVLKSAFKLEAGGMGDTIPVGHVRRAAYWSRLAPAGRRKLLLIENADRMQESGRNALLKILEEPPERAVIVLTTAHSGAMLPTILSRLRPYRFYPRGEDAENEVIRRVFRDSGAGEPAPGMAGTGNRITAYLDSFLPVPDERISALAAFFAASLAYQAALALRNRGPLPEALVALGKRAAPLAEAAGLEKSGDGGLAAAQVVAGAERFDAPGLFSRFLAALLSLVSESIGGELAAGPGGIALADTCRRLSAEAASAVNVYNQSPALVLERYSAEFRRIAAAL